MDYYRTLDFASIGFMTAATWTPVIYYGFYCKLFWFWIYTSLLWLSIIVSQICLYPKCVREPGNTKLIATIFIISVVINYPSILHLIWIGEMDLSPYFWAGNFALVSVVGYAKKFPEKVYPLRFDYFGQSHNLWHFFVLLGGITNFFASLASYYGRRVQICPETALNYIGV